MKKWLSWIIKVSITSGILYYIFTTIPFSEVIKSIVSAKASYIIVALLITLLIVYMEAYTMKILTDKQRMGLSALQIIEINLITRFYGLFLPGYLAGGAIRLYKFSQPENKWTEALASMTFNRLIGTIVLVTLGILFWALDPKSNSNYIPGLILFIMLSGLLVAYFLVFDGKVSCFLRKYAEKINLPLIPRIIRRNIGKLVVSTSQYHSISQSSLVYVFGLFLVSNLLGILSFHLFALSLGMNISFISIGWVRSLVAIISMLPVSFSGLGIREGTLVFLLQPYGISATDAVALSFLFFARTLLVGGIGGLLEAKNLFLPARSKSEVKEKISM